MKKVSLILTSYNCKDNIQRTLESIEKPDYDFMVQILKDGAIKLAYVPITIIRMYYGGTSTAGEGNYVVSLEEAMS